MGSCWLGSTSSRVDSTQHRLGSTRLDIRPGRHGSTSARFDSARHQPDLTRLTPSWVGWLGSILLGMTWLNINPGRLSSKLVGIDSTQHLLGWLGSTSGKRAPDQLEKKINRNKVSMKGTHGPYSSPIWVLLTSRMNSRTYSKKFWPKARIVCRSRITRKA